MNKKISGVTTIIGERKKEFLNMEIGERLLADQIFNMTPLPLKNKTKNIKILYIVKYMIYNIC